MILDLMLVALVARGPGEACQVNRQCRSHVCTGKPRHCHGPATQSQGKPCVDDGDCRSHTCGVNPRTDWPGGRRCL